MSEDALAARKTSGGERPNDVSRRRPAALGRGLGALLGESRREEPVVAAIHPVPLAAAPRTSPEEGLVHLAVADIEPHPGQPRRHFEEVALQELADSIAARGVIQPVIVRPAVDGRYQLVAGERRWRAAQRARLHEIPAIVRRLDDSDVLVLALIENLQREDLSPVEEAQAYQRLGEDNNLSQQQIAKLVDKSRSHVANMIRLLALPHEVLDYLTKGQLSMGHARALVTAPEPLVLAGEVVKHGWSVRDTERAARKAQQQAPSEPHTRRSKGARDSADSADIAAVQNHLEEFLGLKVAIQVDADPRCGAVTIRYKTLDQLDLICQRLTGGAI